MILKSDITLAKFKSIESKIMVSIIEDLYFLAINVRMDFTLILHFKHVTSAHKNVFHAQVYNVSIAI